jgi:hypothetical protein
MTAKQQQTLDELHSKLDNIEYEPKDSPEGEPVYWLTVAGDTADGPNVCYVEPDGRTHWLV